MFATPDRPILDALRKQFTTKLTPIFFHIKNNIGATPWVYDMHFKCIMCSPQFEGKTRYQMKEMVESCAEEVGVKRGMIKMVLAPPSRFHMLKRPKRKRWDIDF